MRNRPKRVSNLIRRLEREGRHTEALALDAIEDWEQVPPLETFFDNFLIAFEGLSKAIIEVTTPMIEAFGKTLGEFKG